MRLKVQRRSAAARLPRYMSEHASGLDLFAAVAQPVTIAPGEWERVPTGLSVEIPWGFEGQVRPRSGLAANQGLTVLNAPGTIDADYRGEVQVLLINLGNRPALVKPQMRVAQLIIAPTVKVEVQEVSHLGETVRGERGFGHTG